MVIPQSMIVMGSWMLSGAGPSAGGGTHPRMPWIIALRRATIGFQWLPPAGWPPEAQARRRSMSASWTSLRWR